MLFIYFFLHKASEDLFKRRQYVYFKLLYQATFALFTFYMSICAMVQFFEVTKKNVAGNDLCIKWYFISFRFGPVAAEIIFLLFVCMVHGKIKALYHEGTTVKLMSANDESASSVQSSFIDDEDSSLG